MIKTAKRLPPTWKISASLLIGGLAMSASILFLLAEFHEGLFEPWLTHLDQLPLEYLVFH